MRTARWRGRKFLAWRLHLADRDLADRGATSIEYALMGTLIAVVIVAAVTLLGTDVAALFNQIAGAF
jgi:pilus assembly protein Flp/PilA